MDSKILISIVDKKMKEHEFKKKNNGWYKTFDNVVVLLYLQRSSYSALYYPCMSALNRKINPDELYPKEHHCHLRTRVPPVTSVDENCKDIFNLESNLSDAERERRLNNLLENYCIPRLHLMGSYEGIETLYAEDPDIGIASPRSLFFKDVFTE